MALDIPPEIDLSLIFERDDVMDAFAGHCASSHIDADAVRWCKHCAHLRVVLALAISGWRGICEQAGAARRASLRDDDMPLPEPPQ